MQLPLQSVMGLPAMLDMLVARTSKGFTGIGLESRVDCSVIHGQSLNSGEQTTEGVVKTHQPLLLHLTGT